MASSTPSVSLHPLVRADGSATFTSTNPPRTTVIAAVHAPLDPPPARRDEQPASAILDVHIRPAHGIATPRFRRLEATLTSLLRAVVAVDMLPRALVRVTLQVSEEETLSIRSNGEKGKAIRNSELRGCFAYTCYCEYGFSGFVRWCGPSTYKRRRGVRDCIG